MYKRVVALWFITLSCFANQTTKDFNALKGYAKSLSSTTKHHMNEFKPHSVFKGYSEEPVQGTYYQGEEKEKTDFSKESANAINNEPGAKTLVEHFGQNKIEINAANPALTQAQLIQDESYAITHGISNERVSCNPKNAQCINKTHEEYCHVSPQIPDQTCVKQRKVTVDSQKLAQRADFSFLVAKKWTGYISVNLFTGAMSHVVSGSMPNPVRLNHPCEQMKATVHFIRNNADSAYWVQIIQNPTCANNGTMIFYVNKGWGRIYPIQVALTVVANTKPYITNEYWENGCTNLENKSVFCRLNGEYCSDASATRIIDGLPVTRDCWEQKATFSCSFGSIDECGPQKNKGCLQIGSQCARFEQNYCALYRQTYSCQEIVCQTPVECVTDLFCADGECVNQAPTQNHDFGQSVSELAVVGEAGKEQSQQPGVSLFGGKAIQCKIWPINIIDCCHDKGWGKDIDLVHCRDEDKELGQAKLNYVAHYLGEFCSQEVAGVCLEHKRSYCVFPSKMARIIQEARLNQLNARGLGDAEHPACEGLSAAQLQRMDLGKVDFVSPIYPYGTGQHLKAAGIAEDFKIKSKDPNKAIDEVTKRLQKAGSSS